MYSPGDFQVTRIAPAALASLGFGSLALVLAACTGSGSQPQDENGHSPKAALSSFSAPADPFEMTVGHCWIDPVVVDGQTWGIDRDDQFGWGGGVPDDWAGTGRLDAVGNGHLIYVDESSHRLDLWPIDDDRAFDPEARGVLCR